jgi:hypothetical protein
MSVLVWNGVGGGIQHSINVLSSVWGPYSTKRSCGEWVWPSASSFPTFSRIFLSSSYTFLPPTIISFSSLLLVLHYELLNLTCKIYQDIPQHRPVTKLCDFLFLTLYDAAYKLQTSSRIIFNSLIVQPLIVKETSFLAGTLMREV